jgi:hypothetical protein
LKKQLFDRTAIRRQALVEKFTTHARAVNAAAIRRYNEEHGTAIIIRQVKYSRNMSVAAGLEQVVWPPPHGWPPRFPIMSPRLMCVQPSLATTCLRWSVMDSKISTGMDGIKATASVGMILSYATKGPPRKCS